jgi:hypothetical protein
MSLSEGLREITAWPRARWGIGIAVAVGFILALAGLSGLAPFGPTVGGWHYPLVVLLAALLGLYGASAVQAPVGAEMTLCDLRWPTLAIMATAYAAREATLSVGLAVLFDVAALTLMVWAVVQRLERERQALHSGDGEVCLTCRPLFVPRSRGVGAVSASAGEPVIRPLATAPVRSGSLPEESGGLP